MTKDQLLSEAISHFSRWRSTRLKQREPTPKALKLRAVSLLDHFRKGQVCEILSLSPSALSQWQRELEESESSAFVQLPALIDDQPDNQSVSTLGLRLVLTQPDGTRLELSGDLSCDFILSLIRGLNR
ncbi:MAG: hypothetical protein OXE99_11425 [Cellvibrionales bacterium]|nr:hypothetical protein [Cellvibrionales bacterium]